MQQYFTEMNVHKGDIISLDEDVLYHLKKVLRKDSDYIFRICDANHRIHYAHLVDQQSCEILDETQEDNELSCDLTCILSLIKNDHFEYCIQKLTELGVKRIVAYQADRSVVKIRDDKKLERIRKIAKEAAEQSHRNLIPEICSVTRLSDLERYMSEVNYLCYESETQIREIVPGRSVTFVIGPEGGFTDREYESLCAMGFQSVSLGKRILRTETAAIYMCSVIVSKCQ